ncbi:protein of unknown function [Burkholderia multivorans]
MARGAERATPDQGRLMAVYQEQWAAVWVNCSAA